MTSPVSPIPLLPTTTTSPIPSIEPPPTEQLTTETTTETSTTDPPPPKAEEEEIICCVCGDGDSYETNMIVLCDGCNVAVHQMCYGIPQIPEDEWLCHTCRAQAIEPV